MSYNPIVIELLEPQKNNIGAWKTDILTFPRRNSITHSVLLNSKMIKIYPLYLHLFTLAVNSQQYI